MKHVNIYISDEQAQYIATQGGNASVTIRTALDQVIHPEQNPLLRGLFRFFERHPPAGDFTDKEIDFIEKLNEAMENAD